MPGPDQPSKNSTEPWRPRRRLRHLHSISLKTSENSKLGDPGLVAYFALWSHQRTPHSDEAACIHISEQVSVVRHQEWLPLEVEGVGLDSLHLDGPLSGLLHLHVYQLPAGTPTPTPAKLCCSDFGHPSTATLKARAQPPRFSPLHDSAGSCHSSDDDLSDGGSGENGALGGRRHPGTKNRETQNGGQGKGREGPDAAHLVGFPRRASIPRAKDMLTYQLSASPGVESLIEGDAQVHDRSLCCEPDLPGELILSTSLDLETLESVGRRDARLLEQAETMLILELKDGSHLVWPHLAMQEREGEPVALAELPRQELGFVDDLSQGKGSRWGGLFRRSTLGSMPDLTLAEASPATPSSLDDSRLPSLPPVASASSLLRANLSTASASTNDLPTVPYIVSFVDVRNSMEGVEKVQRRLQLARDQAAQTLHKLNEAMKARERAAGQRRRLEALRSEAEGKRREAASLAKKGRATLSSCKAARELMVRQTSHLAAAVQKLDDVWGHSEGPEADYCSSLASDWHNLHRKLVARRCRLVAEVQRVYDIQPHTVSVVEAPECGFLWHQLDFGWGEVSMASSRRLPMATMAQKQQQRTPRSTPVEDGALSEGSPSVAGDSDSGMSQAMSELSLAGSQTREVAKLAIVSLNLEPYIERQRSDSLATLGRQSEKERDMRLAAALGYATHVTHHLANYLGVPLKYPLRPANSRSAVLEGQVPVGSMREGRSTEEDAGDGLSQNEYLLYPDGSEQARFSHAIFLLNKDIEQLLESHGLTSAGPSLVLQNLYKLLSAALSAVKT